jgi:hypothetical protein
MAVRNLFLFYFYTTGLTQRRHNQCIHDNISLPLFFAMDAAAMSVVCLWNIWIVSCALQSIKQQQIHLSKDDESPWYISCWIIEPLPVDQ